MGRRRRSPGALHGRRHRRAQPRRHPSRRGACARLRDAVPRGASARDRDARVRRCSITTRATCRAATTSRSSSSRADAMSGDRRAPRDGRAAFPPTRKSLGQHFLSDRRILGRIADALQLQGHETVLEIGPGRGALTDILAERAGRVIAIENDRALAALLRERYARRGERPDRRGRRPRGLARRAGRGTVRARRQRSVLHHDPDPLPRARAAARRSRRVSRAARGRRATRRASRRKGRTARSP